MSERRSVDITWSVMLAQKGTSFVKLGPPRPFCVFFHEKKKKHCGSGVNASL